MTTRRNFLANSSLAVAGAKFGIPRSRFAAISQDRDPAPPIDSTPIIDEPSVRELAARALDAAKAAGAQYADVRLTRSVVTQGNMLMFDGDIESIGVGVRAMINGAWGFAASPFWKADDVVRLAREAVSQATGNSRISAPAVDRGQYPVVTGEWKTPVRIDPFTITREEKADILSKMTTLGAEARRALGVSTKQFPPAMTATFTREERVLATSEGSYVTQILYTAGAGYLLYVNSVGRTNQMMSLSPSGLTTSATGWELVLDADIPGQLPGMVDAALELMAVGTRPGEVGRYDVVLDGRTMAGFVGATLAPNTQLDRILGYEANAGGTSAFGTDPLAVVGNYKVGSPLLTITANRSMPKGLATVKWDDDAVAPEDFTLIKDGVVVDLQTTRDQAALLAPYYQRMGRPARSHGCAWSDSPMSVTMQHSPNLVLEPRAGGPSFHDLIKDTTRGIAIIDAGTSVDFQGRNGMIQGGVMREIVNGKLGKQLTGMAISFSTAEFCKNIIAVGGASSRQVGASSASKGQPRQSVSFTVSGVPVKVTSQVFIDPMRKA